MTNFQKTAALASLVLALATASTAAASAQTTNEPSMACTVSNASAHPLTNYSADRPAQLPSALTYNPTGTALVKIDLSADGTPVSASIVKSTGDYTLDRAAKELVLSEKFAPEIKDCVAVPGSYLYQVEY